MLVTKADHGVPPAYLFVSDWNEETLFGDDSEVKKLKDMRRKNSGQV